MKIAQVTARYYPYVGGTEKHVKDVSERLAKKGYEVDVLTLDPSGKLQKEEQINKVSVKRFGALELYGQFFSQEFAKYMRVSSGEYNVIHSHGYQQAFQMLCSAFFKRRVKAKFVITLHIGYSKIGDWIYAVYDPVFGRYIFERADKIVLVSPATIEFKPLISVYKDKVVYIPNGVDVCDIDLHVWKRKRNPERHMLRMISVCRLERKKGLDKIIDAVQILDDPSFSLHIIGDGSYRERLLKKIRSSKSKSEVKLLGRINNDDLRQEYLQSDLFVLLSDYESHSIALTEAMAFGVIPLVSEVGGNPYVVTQGIDGFLLKTPVDMLQLVNLLKTIQKDSQLLGRMRFSAEKTVRNRFNISKTVEDLIKLYEGQ